MYDTPQGKATKPLLGDHCGYSRGPLPKTRPGPAGPTFSALQLSLTPPVLHTGRFPGLAAEGRASQSVQASRPGISQATGQAVIKWDARTLAKTGNKTHRTAYDPLLCEGNPAPQGCAPALHTCDPAPPPATDDSRLSSPGIWDGV